MRYMKEQYENMVQHVETSILDAELHNGRILSRLEDEEKLKELHHALAEKLLECVALITTIEALQS